MSTFVTSTVDLCRLGSLNFCRLGSLNFGRADRRFEAVKKPKEKKERVIGAVHTHKP